MKLTVRTKLRVNNSHPRIRELINTSTVPNKTFAFLKSQGKWTGNTPREFKYYFSKDGSYFFPRGAANLFDISEVARDFTEGNITFSKDLQIALRPEQLKAVSGFLNKIDDTPGSCGLIEGPCGSGKTIVGAEVVRRLGLKTLILVDQENLMNQWHAACKKVMGLTDAEIFTRKPGKRPPKDTLVDIYTIQTLEQTPLEPHERDMYGLVIVDECHIVPAQATSKVVSSFRSRYLMGLTATPYRIDGLTDVITLFLGDILSKIETTQIKPEVRLTRIPKLMPDIDDIVSFVFKARAEGKDLKFIINELDKKLSSHPEGPRLFSNIEHYLKRFFNSLNPNTFNDFVSQQFLACSWWGSKDEDTEELTGIIGSLCMSDTRNDLIIKNIQDCFNSNRHAMVLSPRKKHIAILKEKLDALGIPCTVYTGDIKSKKAKQEILENARMGNIKVLLATFNLTKKGLDIPVMDAIHLTHPFKIKSLTEGGDLEQAIGRILRPKEKPLSPAAIVYDYIDTGGGPEVLGWRHYRYYKTQSWDIKWVKE